MARVIRPIAGEQEFLQFGQLQVNAYPAFPTAAESSAQRYREVSEKDAATTLWGVFEGDDLVGGMRQINYDLNYHGSFVPVGGVGAVAVDLLHKKQRIAYDLIQFFLAECERRGQYLAMLYPFRPDFYHRMGFGYGPKMNMYSLKPDSLPLVSSNHGLTRLTPDDTPLIKELCDRYAAKHHGFCLKTKWELEGPFVQNQLAAGTVVGYKRDGKLQAYIAYTFKRAHETNFVKNDLVIREWIWDGPEALLACCAFLHTQVDQINRISYCSQDDDFHYLLNDVRNHTDNVMPHVYHETNAAGVGLMYRIVSLTKFLEQTASRDYGGVTADLTLHVSDSFLAQNAGSYHLSCKDGKMTVLPGGSGGIDLWIDIADLSSLLMGSVSLTTLYALGRVKTAEEHVSMLDRLFHAAQKPTCMTGF